MGRDADDEAQSCFAPVDETICIPVAEDTPEHRAEVDAFYLDILEVTWARFRRFADEYTGTPPETGAGEIPGSPNSGWDSRWDANLPGDKAELIRSLDCLDSTYTTEPANHEYFPANCVSWFLAAAFCIWDGGRLPTEAEWEFAATGGDENRVWPWGSPRKPTENYLLERVAILPFDAQRPGDLPADLTVGSKPRGRGRWGQLDMAGSLYEWVWDSWNEDAYVEREECNNCVVTADSALHTIRGGYWGEGLRGTMATFRRSASGTGRHAGFRCARTRP